MKYRIIYLKMMFFLLISSISGQQDYLFENISVAEGLSTAQLAIMNSIYQDQYGFMWFATVEGLNRYDGYNFKVYKNIPNDTTSLPSSNITMVCGDSEGNLWIGTPGNMSRLNRSKDTFRTYPVVNPTNSSNVNISRGLVDSHNNFWIGTQGQSVQRWIPEGQKFELIPFKTRVQGVDTLVSNTRQPVFGMTELRNGNILAASYASSIYFYNESSGYFEEYNLGGNKQPEGIIDLYEDRSGKIWMTGKNSINVYNPVTFSLKSIDDWKNELNSNTDIHFHGIHEEDNGQIFLGGIPYGLATYDPATEKLQKIQLSDDMTKRGVGNFVVSKYKDRFGIYWVGLGDNGILKFDPNRRPFRFFKFGADNVNTSDISFVRDIILDRKKLDNVFVATRKDGIFKFNIKERKYENLDIKIKNIYSDKSNIQKLVLDDNNRLWFSSEGSQIASYNLDSKKSKIYDILGSRLLTGNSFINGLVHVPKNKIIISSTAGIKLFNIETEEIEPLPSLGSRKYNSQLLEDVRELIESKEITAELVKIGEAANEIAEFKVEETSDYLIVCLGEGNLSSATNFDYGKLSDSKGSVIWQMDKIDSTFNGGGGMKNRLQMDVLTLQPGSYQINYTSDVGHSYANFNVASPEDSAWYGIQLIELDSKKSIKYKSLISSDKAKKRYPRYFGTDEILSSRKYPNTIWIGAGNNGIIKYDLSSGNYKQYYIEQHKNSNVFVSRIFEDSKGILWIVFNPSGFYRFDPESETFTSNVSIPDLPQTAINSIVEDFNGNLWISSSSGITKLFRSEKNNSWAVTNFDSKDGIPGGFGQGSMVTAEGEILFGALYGIVAFYPSLENSVAPIPLISDVKISDVSVFDDENKLVLDKSIYDVENIELAFSQNDISFDFSSIHYSRPSKNRVSYKLEGFNQDWIFTNKNFASFTNLEPGNYTFLVKAFSGYGIVSDNVRKINIIVNPPWYRTTAAYISYVLLFIGLIIGIDRIQRSRVIAKERSAAELKEAELRAVAAEAQARLIQAENDRKSRELEEARELQLSMLPKKLPQLPNLDIAVFMQTATEVGGDYYDFHVALDGTLTVAVGDATGHGMKAGTMVTAAKSLFSSYASNEDLAYTFSEMTRCIKHLDMHMVSMCLTLLKIQHDKLRLSAAGMPPALFYNYDQRLVEEITLKGMPLGTVSNFPYEQRDIEIRSGDSILLMSDGLPELMNENKDLFGYSKVKEIFSGVADRTPERIIDELKKSASDWVKGKDPNDDVTLVVIKAK